MRLSLTSFLLYINHNLYILIIVKKKNEIYCVIRLDVILILLAWFAIIIMVLPSSSLAVEAMNHFQS